MVLLLASIQFLCTGVVTPATQQRHLYALMFIHGTFRKTTVASSWIPCASIVLIYLYRIHCVAVAYHAFGLRLKSSAQTCCTICHIGILACALLWARQWRAATVAMPRLETNYRSALPSSSTLQFKLDIRLRIILMCHIINDMNTDTLKNISHKVRL